MSSGFETIGGQFAQTVTVETAWTPPITLNPFADSESRSPLLAALQPKITISGPALASPVVVAPYGVPDPAGRSLRAAAVVAALVCSYVAVALIARRL